MDILTSNDRLCKYDIVRCFFDSEAFSKDHHLAGLSPGRENIMRGLLYTAKNAF